ncbi:hypothetical protein HSX10_11025 [Winogradskyella undariae]|uniref:hypothetical protein n=1 Tax=Winogradskyella undariae TaxID=1285465 RepID=UPI00156BCBAA|nr:hypothetical protein [Winogradskyella undariae]NRR92099.1 hypothetical protein [Winogradskyella undariae]QNK77150.1 hypothetical protein H7F37_13685 [Winogradskyella sp. PAMC22761]
MKNLHRILIEITELTSNIETKYPELYRSLDENPITIPTSQHPHMDKVIMEEYLESLKIVLKNYLKEEKIRLSTLKN